MVFQRKRVLAEGLQKQNPGAGFQGALGSVGRAAALSRQLVGEMAWRGKAGEGGKKETWSAMNRIASNPFCCQISQVL